MKLIALVMGIAAAAAASGATAAQRPSPEERLAKITAGRTAGPPVDCINQRDVRATQIIPGIGIVYTMNNGTLYVNRPAGGTGGIDEDDILVTRTSTSQLCRIDIVTLVDRTSHFGSGSFGLGDFIPYSKPARPSRG